MEVRKLEREMLRKALDEGGEGMDADILEDKTNRLFELDEVIRNFMIDKGEEISIEVWKGEFENVEKYRELGIRLAQRISNAKKVSEADDGKTDQSGISYRNKKNLNLPKIEWIKFDGQTKNWIRFWAQFKKVHNDHELSNEDKFMYLLQACTSKAKSLVESYPPSEENYDKVIDALKGRFARDEMLIEHYIRDLIDLIVFRASSGNSGNQELDLSNLYDRLRANINNLDSLGLTSDKYVSIILPMVESSMPTDLLREWERVKTNNKTILSLQATSTESINDAAIITNKKSLDELLEFIRLEVQTNEKVKVSQHKAAEIRKEESDEIVIETGKDLLNQSYGKPRQYDSKQAGQSVQCLFCNRPSHNSQDCVTAQNMSLAEKRKIVAEKNACFQCLRLNHIADNCNVFVRCLICKRRHFTLLCAGLGEKQNDNKAKSDEGKSSDKKGQKTSKKENFKDKDVKKVASNLAADWVINTNNEVMLQTVRLVIEGPNGKTRELRCLLDGGSSRSYILNSVAKELGLENAGTCYYIHSLFGGSETGVIKHNVHVVTAKNIDDNQQIELKVLGHEKISSQIGKLRNPDILKLLEERGIKLSDTEDGGNADEIQMSIGSDSHPRILTGKMEKIQDELIAIHTLFGWTLLGEVPLGSISRTKSNLCYTMNDICENVRLENFWSLETLGIKDVAEQKSFKEEEIDVLNHFRETVCRNEEGRYEVNLPWNPEKKEQLKDNYNIAERRLRTMTAKLESKGGYEAYNKVFEEWEEEGIIEKTRITDEDKKEGHFLPHRPVIKESSETTKIRPVFDASCKDYEGNSLNGSVFKGPNLIELIPKLLLDFRTGKFGVTADVRKAFLMISVKPEDRKFLKFLWWKEKDSKELMCYRHCRVVFGVSCSPFLLSATINFHIEKVEEEFPELGSTIEKLKRSFYVDNAVTSVNNIEELDKFMKESKDIMDKGKFDLRCWKHNVLDDEEHAEKGECCEEKTMSILGLMWDTKKDTLSCNFKEDTQIKKITKRAVLSITQSIFDPIGFTAPLTILPKSILQEAWKIKVGWDEELPPNLKEKFHKWYDQLGNLTKCDVKRHCLLDGYDPSKSSIHVFVDGSQTAYAACIFVRTETVNEVGVELLMGKARIAPTKRITIPRIELLAAVLGARLYQTILENEILKTMNVQFWTDSMVVLGWLRERREWKQFVENRVSEILTITNKEAWRHVPGKSNPADLLSRGCDAKKLLEKWWGGPEWLRRTEDIWPVETQFSPPEEIFKEAKKIQNNVNLERSRRLEEVLIENCQTFSEMTRIIAWAYRLIGRTGNGKKLAKDITAEETKQAEIIACKLIQKESFNEGVKFKNLEIVEDEQSLLRVKSRLTSLTEKEECFLYPILLPGDHELVKKLIMETHRSSKHPGVLTTMTILRKNYWILKCRKSVKKVIKECFRCERFNAVRASAPPAPLPKERLQAERAFENVGVDLAGPLYTKEGKVWVVIFTCAVYRAVHLEVTSGLSTECFVMALRRFIARRGRMSCIISDNGTNFVGTNNLLQKINWEKITREFGPINKIKWKFNPPGSPWWGGFYERLIRVLKDLLRKNLQKANLSTEQLTTLIIECEGLMNNRPLTYMSEGDDVVALTPAMLLNNVTNTHQLDLNEIDRNSLIERIKTSQRIRDNLRTRFQKEYLENLVANVKTKQARGHEMKEGQYVVIETDKKRQHWPIGEIVQLIKGKDSEKRVAKVRCNGKIITRAIQKLFPLEI